jgi:16S rRNA (adenine1518-N6/adenine1519-N6)-dimethyltransferase
MNQKRNTSASRPRTKDWHPRKSLGQNFLIDWDVADSIVDFAKVSKKDTVLEVGPGKGALTGIIASRAGKVIAVEIDPTLARTVEKKVHADNLTVLVNDMLRTDLAPLGETHGVKKWCIVGNLPYVISSRLTMRFVEQYEHIDRATIMVQREVGERYLADPGSRVYGLLSVLLQATGKLTRGFEVDPEAFKPKPKVKSLVLSWKPQPKAELDLAPLVLTVKAAFAQRRKQLHNSLRAIRDANDEMVDAACETAGIDPSARAESLSADEFIALSRAFIALGAFPNPNTPASDSPENAPAGSAASEDVA